MFFCQGNVDGNLSRAEVHFDEIVPHFIGVIAGVILVPSSQLAVFVRPCKYTQKQQAASMGRAANTTRESESAATFEYSLKR